MKAIIFNRVTAVQILLQAGADPRIQNVSKQSAFDMAALNPESPIVHLLKQFAMYYNLFQFGPSNGEAEEQPQ